ncbi:MAG: hypothetical protein ACTHZX_08825 [Microbacterium sp.]
MSDVLERIIRVASRAPSAHNTQPWRVERGADGIALGLRDERLLRIGDPTGRDALLALGCWIEAATIGARDAGVALRAESDAEALAAFSADPTRAPAAPLVRLRPAGDAEPSGFTAADVEARAVHRGRLAPIADDAGMAAALGEAGLRLVRVPGARAPRLVALGDAGALGRRAVTAEALDWTRFTPRDPRFHRDGLTAPALLIPRPAAAIAGALSRRRAGRALLETGLAAASRIAPALAGSGRAHPGLFALVGDGRSAGAHGIAGSALHPAGLPAEEVLGAGRALLRAWLAAHRAGVAVAPASQVVDAPRAHAALRRGLGLRSADVVLAVFAAGTPQGDPPRSPRLPIA